MSRVLEWQRLTASQIAELDPSRTVVVLTCSPLEVHGPHLPTAADMAESEGLLGRALSTLAERHDDRTFVRLPPIYVAADVLPHRGSLKFSPRTVTSVIEELGTTLAKQGFNDVWVSNFHGGPRHVLAIERAAQRVNRRGGRMISVFSLLVNRLTGGGSDLAARLDGVGGIGKYELRGDTHGGVIETALLLHLVGDHVDPAYKDLPARSLELDLETKGKAPLQRGDRPTFFEIVRSLPLRARYFERETYSGIPGRASPELGKAYLEILASETALALSDLLDGRIAPADCFSPLWPMRRLLLNEMLGRVFDRLVLSRRSPI